MDYLLILVFFSFWLFLLYMIKRVALDTTDGVLHTLGDIRKLMETDPGWVDNLSQESAKRPEPARIPPQERSPMPHYKDGSEARIGHRVKFPTKGYDDNGQWVDTIREGIIIAISPGAVTCNAQVSYPILETIGTSESAPGVMMVKLTHSYITLSDCERVI